VASEQELLSQLKRLSTVLDQRAPVVKELDDYYDGIYPMPPLVQEARVTRAYKTLMALTDSDWPKLVVDAIEERIEVQGIRFGDSDADDEAWEIWQANGLDAESSMLHQAALTDGRAYAIVWAGKDSEPQVTYEHASLCAVEYERGSHRKRKAAIRRWKEGKRWYATLYLPEEIYKFQASSEADDPPREGGSTWERRADEYELPNPLGEVPVIEFAVNRSLRPSPFGTACGEFEPNLRHIDRIHYKIFCGLVALTWSGFPLRALIGDPILRDDDGNQLKPFDSLISDVVQLENPDAKLMQLPEADISNYSPEMDIKHLAALTKTPAYYLLGEMVNISADGIRAGEGGLISKAYRHHRTLGESHEDVIRLCFKVKNADDPRAMDVSAEIIWKDPEFRSLAERADAATKLASINTPWPVIASKVLGMTPQEIQRTEALRSSDVLTQLLTQPQTPNGTTPEEDTANVPS
jgi:hypothetical protein